MEYQPRWINGAEVGQGIRDCAKRYEAIADQLRGHSGFTVLDVGAYNGYFALRLAEEFNAQVTAADDYQGLKPALHAAGDPRVTGLHEKLAPARVRELGPVDVVLCMSVLHHMPDWREMLDAVREAGRVLFIETATAKEVLPKARAHSPEIPEAVAALGGTVIARTPGYKSKKQRPLRMIGSLDPPEPEPAESEPEVEEPAA